MKRGSSCFKTRHWILELERALAPARRPRLSSRPEVIRAWARQSPGLMWVQAHELFPSPWGPKPEKECFSRRLNQSPSGCWIKNAKPVLNPSSIPTTRTGSKPEIYRPVPALLNPINISKSIRDNKDGTFLLISRQTFGSLTKVVFFCDVDKDRVATALTSSSTSTSSFFDAKIRRPVK